MPGYKVWASDDVLTAADMNSYLMQQVVPQFASATTRSGAILSPPTGMITYRADGAVFERWSGSAWVAIGDAVGTVPNATTAANALKVSNQTVFIQSSTPTATATNDLWFW